MAWAEGTTVSLRPREHARVIPSLVSPGAGPAPRDPCPAAVAALRAALAGLANSGRGQHMDMALYGCMISTQDCAVQRCTLGGGINPFFQCLDCGPSPDSLATVQSRHNRAAAAGLGYSDAEADALARDGVLDGEAAR